MCGRYELDWARDETAVKPYSPLFRVSDPAVIIRLICLDVDFINKDIKILCLGSAE